MLLASLLLSVAILLSPQDNQYFINGRAYELALLFLILISLEYPIP